MIDGTGSTTRGVTKRRGALRVTRGTHVLLLGLAVAMAFSPASAFATALPAQMHSIQSGTTQLVIVTGKKIGSKSGTLRLFNKKNGTWSQVLSATANFGRNGLVDGAKRKEGHLQTPTGIWHIGSFAFGTHASAKTKMPYRRIDTNSWWSSARNSTYNTWVESKTAIAGERLKSSKVQYEYAFNSGYNALPNKRVLGRGTAIFIHCFEPSGNSLGKYTHGCVAISRANMVKLFATLDPKRKPCCVIGTEAKGTATAVYSY